MNKQLPKEIKEKLINMLEDDRLDKNEIIKFVHETCSEYHLTDQLLGKIFERYCDLSCLEDPATTTNKEKTFSKPVLISELVETVHPEFRTSNGCAWARDDTGYLGKRYKIKREKSGGNGVSSVKLEGPNKSSIRSKGIRKDIRDTIRSMPCAILDITPRNIECDHKDGHYDNLNNANLATQQLEDYQPLSKAANDAKRNHCKKCKKTGNRYNATRLGYSQAFIYGDEHTSNCEGCYWHDPKHFNNVISKDFKKEK